MSQEEERAAFRRTKHYLWQAEIALLTGMFFVLALLLHPGRQINIAALIALGLFLSLFSLTYVYVKLRVRKLVKRGLLESTKNIWD